MGKYSVFDLPAADAYIQDLIDASLATILDKTHPQSVVLYGSLARGEASLLVSGDGFRLISDCELRVVDPSPRMRGLCAALTRQLSARLMADISIAWMPPKRISAYLSGREPASIFMAEFVGAGRTLYGRDYLASQPSSDQRFAAIPLQSGLLLLLNRMAEALVHLPFSTTSAAFSRLENLTWLNKNILACADALLISEHAYHFSYRERCARFQELAPQKFAALLAEVPELPGLVQRATDYKLRPDPGLYPQDLAPVWGQVARVLDLLLRYLLSLDPGLTFDDYAGYPASILGSLPPSAQAGLFQRLVDALKYLEQRRQPPPVLGRPYSSAQLSYALVPVLFQGAFSAAPDVSLRATRAWLELLGRLPPASPDARLEWDTLCAQLTWAWKTFCY